MNRSEFVQRWRKKASESDDPFDRFFSAWVALVILARGGLDQQQLSQPDTDRKAVIQYFGTDAERVVKVVGKLGDSTAWLAARKGNGTHEPIVDVYPTSPQHLRGLFDTLAKVWTGEETRKPKWEADAIAELVNHIRNHMFHGLKNPDDAADQELIEHVNPILLGVLQ